MKKFLVITMLLIGTVSYSQEKNKEAIIVTSENKITIDNESHNYIVAEAYKNANTEKIEELDKYVFTVYNPLSLFSDEKIIANTELLKK
jgi:hypothetical protein